MGNLIGKRCGKGILPGLDHHLDLDPPVELGEAVRAERRRPLPFKDNPGPQMRSVGRNEWFPLPSERKGKDAGGGPSFVFQGVIQIHRRSSR